MMTENNNARTIDDLLDNPFDMNEPLLPKEMQTENEQSGTSVKLIDRLSPEERAKATQLAEQIPVGNYEAILTYGASAQGELITLLTSNARPCTEPRYRASW